MESEIVQLKIQNGELQLKLNSVVQGNGSKNGESMETEQLPVSMLTSYNESICSSINGSLNAMMTRIDSLMAQQYRNLVDVFGDNSASNKRKIPYDTNGLNSGASSFVPHLVTQRPSDEIINASLELEPPEVKAKPKQSRSTYEIYVSKFKNTTSTEKIIQHIITKSIVKNSFLFSVELLVKQKEKIQKLSYVSFKITTCSEAVNDEILKDEIWAPHFKAVPFSGKKEQPPNDANKNLGGSNSKHSKLHTPSKMNRFNQNERTGSDHISHKRQLRVNFADNNVNGANHHNFTPRNSRANRPNSSLSKQTAQNKQPVNNAVDATIAPNMMQLPTFFGLPGPASNLIHQWQYLSQHQQKELYQQLQLSQQNQNLVQKQQQQHQIQH